MTQAKAAESGKLSTLRAVCEADPSLIAQEQEAEFQATVSYSNPVSHALFVQQSGCGLYVQAPDGTAYKRGDLVEVHGLTRGRIRPYLRALRVDLIRHGPTPEPVAASLSDLLTQRYESQLVTIQGRILTTDTSIVDGHATVGLRVLMEGDRVAVRVIQDTDGHLKDLIDAEVQITGVATSRISDKSRLVATNLRVQSSEDVRLISRPAVSPWTLALTPFRDVMKSYHVRYSSERLRVRGVVTYYQPGEAAVLTNGNESLWVGTQTEIPIRLGETVEATGFPELNRGLVSLTFAELKPLNDVHSVAPKPTTWSKLQAEHTLYDLVSMEGEVISASHGVSRDEYILSSDGAVFSVILAHAAQLEDASAALPVEAGSRVRVSGISYVDGSKPLERQSRYSILMRQPEDLTVLRAASWFNSRHLAALVALLALVLIMVAIRAWVLARRVQEKTIALARQIEVDAALERRMTQLEARRSHILEGINSSASLASILEEITELVSLHLDGAQCWCEIWEGARLGKYPLDLQRYRVAEREIPAREGVSPGKLFAAFDAASEPHEREQEGLAVGVRVATLAIETRRFYSDLRHRSEFDQLTNVPNRFLLHRHLEKLIEESRKDVRCFGLIYIDLDGFKQINDVCGHHVGDIYLQEMANRMKQQLRGRDMLARMGGDEFAVAVANVRGRSEVEEIAQRLERSLDCELVLEGYRLRGGASLGIAMYPEDATQRDALLSAADAAMYVTKNMRRARRGEGTGAAITLL